MNSGDVIGGIALMSMAFTVVLVLLRHRVYRRRVFYNPKQSCVLGMAGPAIETISIHCGKNGFVLPGPLTGAVSGLFEIEVRATITGWLWDPAVNIKAGEFHDVQYLERGGHGVRVFNVSRLLNSKVAGEQVKLTGLGLTWPSTETRLHVCREKVAAEDRVLVVAPHPDDAEIAAFGLYADTRATVVTLTAGDASDRYHNPMQPWMSLSRNTIASMRVWDSLTIPQFAGVLPGGAINLCLPDGRLRDMYLHPNRDFRGEGKEALDFFTLRQMNRSPLLQKNAPCNWRSLVHDLGHIIANAKPTIVVAPHPRLDPHPDHLFATLALVEALQSADSMTARMFLYTVHNRRSELWPFGPAGSGVALLPIFPDDGVCASGFYSHRLSIERQRQKFVALEAMHDVRDMQWPIEPRHQRVGSRIAAEFRAWAHGMGHKPTSYLRRAVRPDELFFVTSLEVSAALARAAAEQNASVRVAA